MGFALNFKVHKECVIKVCCLYFNLGRLVSEVNHFFLLVLLFAILVVVVSLVVAIAIVQVIVW